jgi:hypothetical protein
MLIGTKEELLFKKTAAKREQFKACNTASLQFLLHYHYAKTTGELPNPLCEINWHEEKNRHRKK